jgi:hypothetical protein
MRPASLLLLRLAIVLVLLSGSLAGLAQLLPSVPDAQTAVAKRDDEDLGTVVEQMAAEREQAADRYARLSAAIQRRLDRLAAPWHRVGATVAAMSLAQRLAAVLGLALSLLSLRFLPFVPRPVRRRMLETSFAPGPDEH